MVFRKWRCCCSVVAKIKVFLSPIKKVTPQPIISNLNFRKHSIIPDYTKFNKNIYFLNKIKKPRRPNTYATHTAEDPTPAQHHCWRPNVGAPSTHVAGLNVVAGDPSNQPTVCRRPAPCHTTVRRRNADATHTAGFRRSWFLRRRSPGTFSPPPFNLAPRLPCPPSPSPRF
jgi:hypothetical protein